MAIRAVVLDIGGVLEVVDDTIFPAGVERMLGLEPGDFARLAPEGRLGGSATLGQVTEAEIRAYWRRCLGIDEEQAERVMAEFWRWYVGTLDQRLFDWFASLRPRLRTGIVSNSGPGAREREACWGFEAVTDDIVYSHEVGLAKPDPAIYALAAERLGVRGEEIAFLDDALPNVEGARAAGWHAVLHVDTRTSIRELERLIDTA